MFEDMWISPEGGWISYFLCIKRCWPYRVPTITLYTVILMCATEMKGYLLSVPPLPVFQWNRWRLVRGANSNLKQLQTVWNYNNYKVFDVLNDFDTDFFLSVQLLCLRMKFMDSKAGLAKAMKGTTIPRINLYLPDQRDLLPLREAMSDLQAALVFSEGLPRRSLSYHRSTCRPLTKMLKQQQQHQCHTRKTLNHLNRMRSIWGIKECQWCHHQMLLMLFRCEQFTQLRWRKPPQVTTCRVKHHINCHLETWCVVHPPEKSHQPPPLLLQHWYLNAPRRFLIQGLLPVLGGRCRLWGRPHQKMQALPTQNHILDALMSPTSPAPTAPATTMNSSSKPLGGWRSLPQTPKTDPPL